MCIRSAIWCVPALWPSCCVNATPTRAASLLHFPSRERCLPLHPPAELDISDSGREGCAVSTLTITSEPKDWRGAVQASGAWPTALVLANGSSSQAAYASH